MRAPLPLQHLAAKGTRVPFVAQILWLLGKIDAAGVDEVRVPAGDPVQNSLAELLEAGVYIRSINPVNPRLVTGPGGVAHMTEVWRQFGISESAIAAHVTAETASLRRTMEQRAAVAVTHHMHYMHEGRLGKGADLHKAMADGHIVGLQPRYYDGELLLLPGTGGEECWLYDPDRHEASPASVMNAELVSLPMYAVFSNTP